jgi:hypothetical protein
MIDPFSRTRFHSNHGLETWYPVGVLDGTMATCMANYISFEERIVDAPFNRYVDLTQLSAIHLDFIELAVLAAERRASYDGGPSVKSAILAINKPAYGVAHMFAALMEPSPIAVQVFRSVEDAARWLDVPVVALHAEP